MSSGPARSAPFSERPTLVPLDGGRTVLEGLWHKGASRPAILVLPPPPAEGGSMDHVVVAELAFAAARAGFASLRFNYRGVGASQGQRAASPDELLADAVAALVVLEENLGRGEGLDAGANGATSHAAPVAVVAALWASDAVALALARSVPLAGLVLVDPSLVKPEELRARRSSVPTTVVLGADAPDGAATVWEASREALEAQDVWVRLAPGANRAYQRGLTHIGRATVEHLDRCGGRRAHGSLRAAPR